MAHDQHAFLDVMLDFRLPINQRGYIEDELLTLSQLRNEYPTSLFNIHKEIRTGRLQVLRTGAGILVARSEADRLQDAYSQALRCHANAIKNSKPLPNQETKHKKKSK